MADAGGPPLVEIHPNPAPPELHPFDPQAEPLLVTFGPGESDPPARGDDAVPRQAAGLLEGPDRGASSPGHAGDRRDLTIRRDAALRDPGDNAP